jgi:Cellulase (glycosyl hydrolase family 5)
MRNVIYGMFVFFSIINVFGGTFYRPVTTLFSDREKINEHGAWLSGLGKATFKSRQNAAGKWLAALQNGKQCKIGFHKHRPLPLNDIPANSSISLEIKCVTQGQPDKIAFRWLYEGRQSSAIGAVRFVTSKTWQTISIPLPEKTANKSAKGFLLILGTKGGYEFTAIKIVQGSELLLVPFPKNILLKQNSLKVTGQAAKWVKNISASVNGKLLKSVAVKNAKFTLDIPKALLPAYSECEIALLATGTKGKVYAFKCAPVFVFPEVKHAKLPRITVKNGKLIRNGKPFAFTGINYTHFQLGLSRRSSMGYKCIAEAVKTMADWKMTVVRIPLNVGLIQPGPEVFPDNPRWKTIYRQHNLNPQFFNYLEYLIQLAADNGIYSVIDFHGFPVNPFRYFLGGNVRDLKKGKPGTAISWLSKDKTKKRKFPEFHAPEEIKALCDTFNWLASRFKGNPNLLGFEVPYNEPHCAYMSIPRNYNRIVAKIIKGITDRDPTRLTFTMPASWGHDNASWSATWMPPHGASGGAPHFYMANGPVPLRPDAKKFRHPWLCRDVNATFSYSLAAVLLPYSMQNYPVYSGESGEHGYNSLLPALPPVVAAEYMINNTLTQYYAAGLSGTLQWTLWNHSKVYKPFMKIYRSLYRRFAPVYAAGPIDWSKAQVAFIQNVAAVPVHNGHNYSCVPLARLMLDLHLAPVHYLTDDQIIYTGLSSVSKGLEQVSEASFSSTYKALIVDKRNLDARIIRSLKRSKIPVLWTDNAAKLKPEDVAAFLRKAGIFVNTKSPPQIQIIKGPKHLILYRRSGDKDKRSIRVFPKLDRDKDFKLTDEKGKVIFSGNSASLFKQGIKVIIPKWRSLILTITP